MKIFLLLLLLTILVGNPTLAGHDEALDAKMADATTRCVRLGGQEVFADICETLRDLRRTHEAELNGPWIRSLFEVRVEDLEIIQNTVELWQRAVTK